MSDEANGKAVRHEGTEAPRGGSSGATVGAGHAPPSVSRRSFLKGAGIGAAALSVPAVWTARAAGAVPASERITIGVIGTGRMAGMDMNEVLGDARAQIVAVCDVDSNRRQDAKQRVEGWYARYSRGGSYKGCASYGDFRELIARPDIDAVMICTPDHWHAIPAITAARAGKDIFIQKPLTLTIEEGRVVSDTVRAYGRILQVGSQQRSDTRFRFACELVRNGRIGKLHTVNVGLPTDPSGTIRAPMPVPPQLDYEMWLGPAPWARYTEERVHPQKGYDRPGWLRMADYCLGMITGWGSHHNDIAQWGMDTELTGPVEVQAEAEYPEDGIWDVHMNFRIDYTYASGVKVICADDQKNKAGVLFEGSEGWVYVDRGKIDASPKSLLTSVIGPNEIHLYQSNSHKSNWLQCIRTRRDPIAPVEVAHRSCTVCSLGYIAMRLGRKLRWDPKVERFVNDPMADRFLRRPMRAPWRL